MLGSRARSREGAGVNINEIVHNTITQQKTNIQVDRLWGVGFIRLILDMPKIKLWFGDCQVLFYIHRDLM